MKIQNETIDVRDQDQRGNDNGNAVVESVTPPDQKDVVNKAFYR